MAHDQPRFVAYARVSTAAQGRSGLGLEAQKASVERYVASRGGRIIGEYIEVESGARNDRPQLTAALARCKISDAVLVVARLDRLSRDAKFLLTLRDSAVRLAFVDLPDASDLTIGLLAILAQHERQLISSRTRDALAAAKARGRKLGGRRPGSSNIADYQAQGVARAQAKATAAAEDRRHMIEPLVREGLSLRTMVARLNEAGITTSRGGSWTATAVKRARVRLSI